MYGYNNSSYGYNQNVDERIWVQSRSAAEAYLIAPNGFARLWDVDGKTFYEKRSDASGRPMPLSVFEYNQKMTEAPAAVPDMKAEIDALKKRISALEEVGHVTESTADPAGV